MGLINDQLAIDGEFFVDGDVGFGESVTYTKRSGTTRAINAVVNRNPPERMNADGSVTKPLMTAEVRNSATTGIAMSELNTGGDTITVAYRLGTTSKAYQIALAPSDDNHDAGMLTLELS